MSVDQAAIFFDSHASEFNYGDIVLIGGFSRSGKTTFAEHLRLASLRRGIRAWTISIDRWLKDLDCRTPGVMGRYDLSKIRDILSLRQAKHAKEICLALPEYNKYTQRKEFTGESILIYPQDILIVEGTIALTLAAHAIRARCFYLEIDESIRRLRVIDEYISRGKTPAEAARIYIDRQLDEIPVIQQSSFQRTCINATDFNLSGNDS
jgi:uridine kinase